MSYCKAKYSLFSGVQEVLWSLHWVLQPG